MTRQRIHIARIAALALAMQAVAALVLHQAILFA